jgi:hypothetical protein
VVDRVPSGEQVDAPDRLDWIEDSGDAPVPPSWPEISTRSAFAFDTPAATVPTPISATSLTDTCAFGLEQRRS